LSVSKGAVVIDTRMNYQKIERDFSKMEKKVQSLANKFNKSCDSIKSQELAIDKVKRKIDDLNKNGIKSSSMNSLINQTKKEEAELDKLWQKILDLQSKQDVNRAKIQRKEKVMNNAPTPSVKATIENDINDLLQENKQYESQLDVIREKYDTLLARVQDNKTKVQETKEQLEETKNVQLNELNNQLELMNSKLSQSKEEANQTKQAYNEALKQKGSMLGSQLDSIKEKFSETTNNIKKFGNKITKALSPKGIGKSINDIGSKIDKFKHRMTRLIGTVMIFSLLRKGLTALRNGFTSLLKTDDSFNNSLNQIKANLMTAFAPIYNAVLPAINTLMSALSKLTGTIATFVSGLFGKSLSDSTKQAKKLSSALDDTAASGENASGSLASFDKLEVIGSDSSSGGSSGNGGIDYSGEIESSSKLLEALNKIKELITTGDWGGLASLLSEKIITGLDIVSEKIKSIPWKEIGTGISDFLTNIDFSGILVGLVTVFGEAILGFQDLFLAIDWATVLHNLGQGIANAIFKINEYINLIRWEDIGQIISDTFNAIPWADIGTNILNLLWDALKGLVDLFLAIDWSKVGKTISNAVKEWTENIIKKFAETDWNQLGTDIANAIFDFIESVDWLELAKNILQGLALGIESFAKLVVSAFKQLLQRILDFFGIHSPSKVFADMGINMIQGLINGLKSMVNSVVNCFKDLWSKIKSVFSSVGSFFGGIWNTIKSKFTDIGTKIGNAIGGAFKSAINSVLSTVENGINFVPSTINKAIKTINMIPGVNIPKMDKIRLPRLAKGTVIPPRHEFAAILGDQKHGTNIEAPLETIKQANREVLQEFMAKFGGLSNQEKEIVLKNLTFVLQMGSTDFRKFIFNEVRVLEKELGKPLWVS